MTWLEEKASWENGKIRISWRTAAEKQNEKFLIHRSKGNASAFELVAEIPSHGESEGIQHYQFEYREVISSPQVYFQVEQIDFSGKSSKSRVFRLEGWELPPIGPVKLWPNPYSGGPIRLQFPSSWDIPQCKASLWSGTGHLIFQCVPEMLEEKLQDLTEGLYFLRFSDGKQESTSRLLIKR